TVLPMRRAELVSWPAENSGQYLVRNRHTGETFQIGEEEAFLLDQLDGQRTVEEIGAAFSQRFGEALTEEDFKEFVQLAGQRGVFQPEAGAGGGPKCSRTAGPFLTASASRGERPPWKRFASRALQHVSTLLRWLSAIAGRLELFRLKHLTFVPR